MRYLLIVLDGAGDTGKQTPLFLARKPWMDKLAETGVLGTLDIG
ncbi:MAG: phosphoglycerate mutase, partial [Candidatus Aenigmatarchaeota archaeon]